MDGSVFVYGSKGSRHFKCVVPPKLNDSPEKIIKHVIAMLKEGRYL